MASICYRRWNANQRPKGYYSGYFCTFMNGMVLRQCIVRLQVLKRIWAKRAQETPRPWSEYSYEWSEDWILV